MVQADCRGQSENVTQGPNREIIASMLGYVIASLKTPLSSYYCNFPNFLLVDESTRK